MTDANEICSEVLETGYCVVPDVLPASACDALIGACREAHRRFAHLHADAPSTATVHGSGNVALVHNLHNKNRLFLDLVFHPLVDEVARHLLSRGSYRDAEPYQLALSQARGLTGPHPAQQLHIDSYLPGLPYILVLQAAWVLTDFAAGSGATCIVPGSNRRQAFAEDGVRYDSMEIPADRGSLLLFDGGLWHGSSEKTTSDERWVVFNRYSRWFMRPSFDLTRNIPDELLQGMNDHQRRVLGFYFRPPVDEFTRVTRISEHPEHTTGYRLPKS